MLLLTKINGKSIRNLSEKLGDCNLALSERSRLKYMSMSACPNFFLCKNIFDFYQPLRQADKKLLLSSAIYFTQRGNWRTITARSFSRALRKAPIALSVFKIINPVPDAAWNAFAVISNRRCNVALNEIQLHGSHSPKETFVSVPCQASIALEQVCWLSSKMTFRAWPG